MTEIFRHYANCNGIVNRDMLEAVAKKPGAYDEPVEGFFGSIGEILDHIYVADLAWIKSFASVRNFAILSDPVFASIPNGRDRTFTDLDSFVKGRTRLDGLIVRFADELTEADLPRTMSRITRKGDRQEKLFWKALVHMFNHETHHRGQVSLILDQMKVDNDYSNMIRIE